MAVFRKDWQPSEQYTAFLNDEERNKQYRAQLLAQNQQASQQEQQQFAQEQQQQQAYEYGKKSLLSKASDLVSGTIREFKYGDTNRAKQSEDSLYKSNVQNARELANLLKDPNSSPAQKARAKKALEQISTKLSVTPNTSLAQGYKDATLGNAVKKVPGGVGTAASTVFGGVEKTLDAVDALTGQTERRQAERDRIFNELEANLEEKLKDDPKRLAEAKAKIRKERQRLLQSDLKDTAWAGTEDKGLLDRTKKAAGVSLQATSEIVPFLKGAKALEATTKGGAALGGVIGAANSTGRELNNPDGFDWKSVGVETVFGIGVGAIAGKLASKAAAKKLKNGLKFNNPETSKELAERVASGKLSKDMQFVPTKGLQIGGDSTPTNQLDLKRVAKYVDDLKAGRAIDPIIVDSDGLVQDGAHRLAAFKKLGLNQIPVVQQLEQATPPLTKAAQEFATPEEFIASVKSSADDVTKAPFGGDETKLAEVWQQAQPSPTQQALTSVSKDASQEVSVVAQESDNLLDVAGKISENQSKLADTMENTYPTLKGKIQKFTHTVRDQKALSNYADEILNTDPVAAREMFDSGSLAQINPDAHVKLGQKLANQAAKAGDTPSLNQILYNHQTALTSHAQAMRAAQTVDILEPDALVTYAAKVADKNGRPLSKEMLNTLESQAKIIAKLPEGPEKALQKQALKEMVENRGLMRKGGKAINQVFGSFRATLASTDLSGGGRQGAVAFTRYPDIGAKAQLAGARAAFSQDYFDQEVAKLANLTDENGIPLSDAFKRMKLSVNTIKGQTSEQFTNATIVEGKLAKKLGIGHVIEGSNRAYDITLDNMRANIAKRIIDGQGGVEELSKRWSTKQWRDMGRVIDTITGVGRGGPGILSDKSIFDKIAPALSEGLFSAKLWKSRLDLLNPLYYADVASNPEAFKLAVRSGSQFATTVGAVLTAAAAAGATVETDLRSSDFGKIKIGNTRVDIMGGLQQNLVFAWRELSGQYKSSTTGNVTDLNNPGYGGQDRLGVAGNMVTNKLTPVLAEIIRQIKGEDIGGDKLDGGDRLKSVGSNFIPLSIQGIYEGLAEDGPTGGALALTSLFGTGVGSYGPKETNWVEDESKTITQFRNQYGPIKTDEAQKKFDQQYNDWLAGLENNQKYQALTVQEQADVRASKKAKIKNTILKSYGFKYKKENNDKLKGF